MSILPQNSDTASNPLDSATDKRLTRKQRQKAKRQVRREAEREQSRKRTEYLRSLSMRDLMVRCGAKTGNGVIMLGGNMMTSEQKKLWDDWFEATKLVEVSPGRWGLPPLDSKSDDQGAKS